MEKKFFVYPYTQNSKSAIALTENLGGKRVLRAGSSYSFKSDHLLINWGCGDCPHPEALNSKILDLINKTKFFKRLKGKGLTPEFATTIEAAKKLSYPVFCRTVTEGHDGKGIVVADCEGQIVSAPLYVQGINKTAEYRIHIGRLPNGEIEFLGGAKKHKKAITPDMKNVPYDTRIWCGDSTVFGDFTSSGNMFPSAAIAVVGKTMDEFKELTFAAFDVVYDANLDKAYVIEGNSAPMATPQTTKAYGDFFRKYAAMLLAKEAEAEIKVEAPVAPVPVVAEASPAAPVRSTDAVAADIAKNIVELIQIVTAR